MGLFNLLFGSREDSDDEDDNGDDDGHGIFSSVFRNPGDTTEDEDPAFGNYKEKDWYD